MNRKRNEEQIEGLEYTDEVVNKWLDDTIGPPPEKKEKTTTKKVTPRKGRKKAVVEEEEEEMIDFEDQFNKQYYSCIFICFLRISSSSFFN